MNLDELNELWASAWSSEDKALILEGLVRGSNGSEAPPSAPAQMAKANAVGLKWRREAEGFLAKSVADGLKSAEARRAKNGTAQPPSANSRTPFEESSNQATSYKLQAVKEQPQEALAPLAGDVFGGATEQQPEKASGEATAQHLSDVAPALRSELTTPPKAPRKRKTGPHIPTLEEFVAWAAASHPGWSSEASAWYKRMESQDWLNGFGKPVMNAKATFNTAMANGWIKKLATVSTGWAKI